jgi:hypothetical protein
MKSGVRIGFRHHTSYRLILQIIGGKQRRAYFK